ncbi:aromatic acid exporter family protein [Paenibacillus sp. J5C_2022]|uniref:aromatic acid exporter family protein n=1 Tax=Paenibacillus sp. J5C2022 TaxID=2977129 RepID=UPI0021D2E1E8|nr:aromatic acid exporter family protein [Paenibacillus sp. J5C2022]MCU6708223.1 aromatic acid exporter family protein [Paenibacillus sp. J5C2022]
MGIRVIKTAVAAIAAIYTAMYLGIEPALSAGIMAILGVEVTRMKGLKSVSIRFVASVLGLFFGSLIFTLLGFQYWSVAIFIMITFPILARFQLKDGILTSAVIVFHIFDHGEVNGALIANEIVLLLVGLGWATVINFLYMPKEEHGLKQLREETERMFGEMFRQMALTLRDPAHLWGGEELLAVEQAIGEGSQLSLRSKENRLWGHEPYWAIYFEMRKQQLDSISSMLTDLAFVYEKLPQNEWMAQLLEQLSGDVKSEVYRGGAERKLYEMKRRFKEMRLPATREEFEVRATLYNLLREVERYLSIAKRLQKKPRETVVK